MKIIQIDDSVLKKYNYKINYVLPQEISHQSLLTLDENSVIVFDGIILNDGEQYNAVDTQPRHSFVYFALSEMGFDVTNAIRICFVQDAKDIKFYISSAKPSQSVSLAYPQIVGLDNLFHFIPGLSWEKLIESKSVFDLGFDINEDNALGLENLRRINDVIEGFDYQKCLSLLSENSALGLK